MKTKIIKLTKNKVVFNTEKSMTIGEKMDLSVSLPKGATLDYFTLNGTISACRPIFNSGTETYVLEMDLHDLSKENRLILEAYMDFLEREATLDRIGKDNLKLQDALGNLGEKFMELIAVSEQLIQTSQGKMTIH